MPKIPALDPLPKTCPLEGLLSAQVPAYRRADAGRQSHFLPEGGVYPEEVIPTLNLWAGSAQIHA
jgi:hypothetical protein